MIYLTCVMRGQLDPVFSSEDERKSEQDLRIKYNVQILKCSFSGLYPILFNSHENYITLNTIHVTALENYTKSNNIITKLLTEL